MERAKRLSSSKANWAQQCQRLDLEAPRLKDLRQPCWAVAFVSMRGRCQGRGKRAGLQCCRSVRLGLTVLAVGMSLPNLVCGSGVDGLERQFQLVERVTVVRRRVAACVRAGDWRTGGGLAGGREQAFDVVMSRTTCAMQPRRIRPSGIESKRGEQQHPGALLDARSPPAFRPTCRAHLVKPRARQRPGSAPARHIYRVQVPLGAGAMARPPLR